MPAGCWYFSAAFLMTRLDQALVDRGLCESRERAKRAILAGQVRVNSQRAHKSSDSVRPDDALALETAEKYVSRGGYKLEHALRLFQLDVTGLVALDLGASTGGFTDCLLQHGAAKVFAVDGGQGQLAWKLRQDRRVVVMEKTNARFLTLEKFGGTSYLSPQSTDRRRQSGTRITRPPADKVEFAGIELITIDCSFISLRKILPAAIALLKPNGKIVALIKPQFEAGKTEADKGRGVINNPEVHERVVNELREFAAAQPGLYWRGVVESPLLGPAGNKEFLALIEKKS
jgi:23S rRNA (cytidine1920-2'-O)/16S rRNA (cytidine1409-2'-O)-methyltransferase